MSRHVAIVAAVLLACAGASARPQEKEEKADRPPKAESKGEARSEGRSEARDEKADRQGLRSISGVTTSLKVQLVISRYQGEKKTGSLPYTFLVTAGSTSVRMRMGVDTPVPTTTYNVRTTAEGEQKQVPSVSYQYRTVGTNIDCSARDFGEGRYQLNLTIENSAAVMGPGAHDSSSGAPLFRRFETFLNPLLRDGQSLQTIASTDPVTGEVVKIDVTLNVAK